MSANDRTESPEGRNLSLPEYRAEVRAASDEDLVFTGVEMLKHKPVGDLTDRYRRIVLAELERRGIASGELPLPADYYGEERLKRSLDRKRR